MALDGPVRDTNARLTLLPMPTGACCNWKRIFSRSNGATRQRHNAADIAPAAASTATDASMLSPRNGRRAAANHLEAVAHKV